MCTCRYLCQVSAPYKAIKVADTVSRCARLWLHRSRSRSMFRASWPSLNAMFMASPSWRDNGEVAYLRRIGVAGAGCGPERWFETRIEDEDDACYEEDEEEEEEDERVGDDSVESRTIVEQYLLMSGGGFEYFTVWAAAKLARRVLSPSWRADLVGRIADWARDRDPWLSRRRSNDDEVGDGASVAECAEKMHAICDARYDCSPEDCHASGAITSVLRRSGLLDVFVACAMIATA